ncbi:MAG: glycosyltransferase [Succinivibrio sp.]|nr:glycosyltransferase [Succinivibrio sp.]
MHSCKSQVYDNNSTDATASLASKAGAIVCTEPRQGKGNVIRSMFRNIEADCYILVDGDNTYPASVAPAMAQAVLEQQVDMVVGDRLSSTYFQENKRRFHGFGNLLVRLLINRLIAGRSAHIEDVMTGYRAFSRTFVKSFPITSRGFEIETEMTAHALDKNLVILNLPVDYRDRPEGSSSKLSTVSDGLRVIATIFNLLREYRPLLFFSLCALISFIIFAASFSGVFMEYLNTGLVPRQPTLLVSLFCLLIAVLCVFSGLILDSLARKSRRDFELFLMSMSKSLNRDQSIYASSTCFEESAKSDGLTLTISPPSICQASSRPQSIQGATA